MEHHVDCFVEFNPLMKECRVCDALLACEQRIYSRDIFMDAWMKGRNDGLNAAEAAVLDQAINEIACCACNEDLEASLAAIRALKEK